eukprot:scaffold4482_cov393-Prasinococcus_capsulatus_cf.AAC.3
MSRVHRGWASLSFGLMIGKGQPLLIDESSITGESLAVTKRRGDEVRGGGVVQQGELEAVVTYTGEDTFFGKAIALLQSVKQQGHIQILLAKVAKSMAAVAAVFCISLFLVLLVRDKVNADQAIKVGWTLVAYLLRRVS